MLRKTDVLSYLKERLAKLRRIQSEMEDDNREDTDIYSDIEFDGDEIEGVIDILEGLTVDIDNI